MITAAPVSLSLAGRHTVSVGLVTSTTRRLGALPVTFSSFGSLLAPGTLSGKTSRTVGLSDRLAAGRTRKPGEVSLGGPCRLKKFSCQGTAQVVKSCQGQR